ncbi:MAG TPA: hypothetical protein VJI33_05085 [Candidatus Paceibacterota bacterium]
MSKLDISALLLLFHFAAGTGFGQAVEAHLNGLALGFAIAGLILTGIIATACIRPFKILGLKKKFVPVKTNN